MSSTIATSAEEWAALVAREFVPLSVRRVDPQFRGAVSPSFDGELISVATVACGPSALARTPRLVRTEPREEILLTYRVHGMGVTNQGESRVEMTAGSVALYPTDNPYTMDFSEPISEIVVKAPHGALAERLGWRDPVELLEWRTDSALTRVFASCLRELATWPLQEDLYQLESLELTTVDLLRTVLDRSTDPRRTSGEHSGFLRVMQQFVTEHLADPDLRRSTIAAAHGVSERYVTELFRRSGSAPAGYIRERRLEKAQTMLTRHSNTPVTVAFVAHSCGFSDQTTFTRAFRRRFGEVPSTFVRRQEPLPRTPTDGARIADGAARARA